jgi:hypothetical protein
MTRHSAYQLTKYGFKVSKATSFQEKSSGGNIASVYFDAENKFASQWETWGDVELNAAEQASRDLRLAERGRVIGWLYDQDLDLIIPHQYNGGSSTEEISIEKYVEAMDNGWIIAITSDDNSHSWEVIKDGNIEHLNNVVEIHTKNNVIIIKSL